MKMGPGAISGLERIFLGKVSPVSLGRGHFLFSKFNKEQCLDLARMVKDVQGVVYSHMNVDFKHFRGRALTMKNIEHALCEFSKYCNCWDAASSKGKERAKVREWNPESGAGSMRNMDVGGECEKCGEKEGTWSLTGCDTCTGRWCGDCYRGMEWEGSWQCKGCVDLEAGCADSEAATIEEPIK